MRNHLYKLYDNQLKCKNEISALFNSLDESSNKGYLLVSEKFIFLYKKSKHIYIN